MRIVCLNGCSAGTTVSTHLLIGSDAVGTKAVPRVCPSCKGSGWIDQDTGRPVRAPRIPGRKRGRRRPRGGEDVDRADDVADEGFDDDLAADDFPDDDFADDDLDEDLDEDLDDSDLDSDQDDSDLDDSGLEDSDQDDDDPDDERGVE